MDTASSGRCLLSRAARGVAPEASVEMARRTDKVSPTAFAPHNRGQVASFAGLGMTFPARCRTAGGVLAGKIDITVSYYGMVRKRPAPPAQAQDVASLP